MAPTPDWPYQIFALAATQGRAVKAIEAWLDSDQLDNEVPDYLTVNLDSLNRRMTTGFPARARTRDTSMRPCFERSWGLRGARSPITLLTAIEPTVGAHYARRVGRRQQDLDDSGWSPDRL